MGTFGFYIIYGVIFVGGFILLFLLKRQEKEESKSKRAK